MPHGSQQSLWILSPFFRILIPFLGGILLETYFPVPVFYLITEFLLSVLLLSLFHWIPFTQKFQLEWIAGVAMQIIFFSLAGIILYVHSDKPILESPAYDKTHPDILVLQLLNDPVPKQKSLKSLARLRWLVKEHSKGKDAVLKKEENYFYENERILLYFPKNTDVELKEGSIILMRKGLQPIENMPGVDFDYRKYCRLRHIYGQVFLKENEFAVLTVEKERSIFSSPHAFSSSLQVLRKKMLAIIKQQVPSKSENGLLEALMVGFTDDLDPALLKSYADSGVIHIIAISGLHLALICQILQVLLQRTGKKIFTRWIKFILIVGIVWGYSLLSGASPSVIRSAMMFSIVLWGRNIFRESILYNGLAGSAFLLLCFDPNWIWDTGFQLSYAAVLSLGLFSKPVRQLIPVENKLLSMLWEAASVSLAAQILTTPISIFYFHRFPSYFLVANLVAVPLSSAILIGGILLSAFSWISPAGKFIGWLLGYGIQILNGFIRYISQLPGAVISSLTLSITQLVLSYIILFCFFRFLKRKEKSWLLTGLGAICLFQLARFLN